jgi:hypothetical protein
VDLRGNDGRTPLDMAILNSHTDVVHALQAHIISGGTVGAAHACVNDFVLLYI